MIKYTTPLLILFFLVLFAQKAYAQEVSLGIFPPVIEITATPPALIQAPVSIFNYSENAIDLEIAIQPFTMSKTLEGRVEFVPKTGPDPKLIEKIELLDGQDAINLVHLEPKQSKDLIFSLSADKKTSLGDYYFSIIFIRKERPEREARASQTPAGIGTNVLLSIGPKGKTHGLISQFKSPLFATSGPIKLVLRLKNTSDHFILPTGIVTIQNIFGQRIAKINILPQYILAGTTRSLRDAPHTTASSQFVKDIDARQGTPFVLYPDKFLLGLYTATAAISLSDSGPLVTAKTYFLAIPIPIIVVLAFLIFVAIGVYLRVRKKIHNLK